MTDKTPAMPEPINTALIKLKSAQMCCSDAVQFLIEEAIAALQSAQPAAPSIPNDGPSTYEQRFSAAVAVICGVTPPATLVADWVNKVERDDDLQQWVGSHAPGWVQNIAVLDAAHQMADQPTEGGGHEAALRPQAVPMPEPVQRLRRYAGQTMRTARNPNITAREAIEIGDYLAAIGITAQGAQGGEG